MPDKRRTLRLLGQEVSTIEVPIRQRTEQMGEYTLEDGAVIRLSAVPMAVLRVEGQWTPDGDPVYLVKHGTVVTVVESPEDLRRPHGQQEA